MRAAPALLLYAGLTACASDTDLTSQRVPSLDPSLMAPNEGFGGKEQGTSPCAVRYDFTPPEVDLDCIVNLGRSGVVWAIHCPSHPIIPTDQQFLFSDGKLELEGIVTSSGESTTLEFARLDTQPGCTRTAADAQDRPTVVRCKDPDSTAALGDQTTTFEYDDIGRLVAVGKTETMTGRVLSKWTVSYDDGGRQRSWTGVTLPDEAGRAESSGYELFDEEFRIILGQTEQLGSILTNTYSYDREGQLVTKTGAFVKHGPPQVSYSYAEHRIYCP